MKTTTKKIEQVDRLIMAILSSGSNSVQNAKLWVKLIDLRAELKSQKAELECKK